MKAFQLGRYHLLDRIAFGGMAEIYRAKTFDEQGRVHMVAVKRILSHLARDEEFIKMLVDEARIASLMQHENIAKTYEFCHAGGEYFIAMEYVDGKDGRTLLDRCRSRRLWIPSELCAFIIMNAARALHLAHIQTDREGRPLNLIHRDVSPSNIICAYAGEVKLCDFGIAKATLSQVQTRSGVIKGKVKYMSPEQAFGKNLDPRSDIFSAGSVLYEFLTKVPPFLAPNEMELLVRVREARYTPVRERNPLVPPALEAIVDTAMARDLGERYQTAEEFASALEGFLQMHAPGLTRSHLGQFVRHLFAADIEKELRALEDFVVEDQASAEVGVNLIAEDLGPGAEFRRFSPNPTSHVEPEDLTPQDPREGEIDAWRGREGGEDVSEEPGSPTVILETSDLLKADAQASVDRSGSAVEQNGMQADVSAEILWRRGDPMMPSEPAPNGAAEPFASPGEREGSRAPQGVDGAGGAGGLHDAKTQILDLGELDGGREALSAPSQGGPSRADPVGDARMSAGGPQMARGGPGVGPGGPQMASGGPQMARGGPGVGPGGPRMAPGVPGVGPGGPRMARGGPGVGPGGPQMAPGVSGVGPGGPQMAPGGPQMAPGGPQMAPGVPGVGPGGPQMVRGVPGVGPGGPRMAPPGRAAPERGAASPPQAGPTTRPPQGAPGFRFASTLSGAGPVVPPGSGNGMQGGPLPSHGLNPAPLGGPQPPHGSTPPPAGLALSVHELPTGQLEIDASRSAVDASAPGDFDEQEPTRERMNAVAAAADVAMVMGEAVRNTIGESEPPAGPEAPEDVLSLLGGPRTGGTRDLEVSHLTALAVSEGDERDTSELSPEEEAAVSEPPGDAEGTSELSSEELEEVSAAPGDAEGTSELSSEELEEVIGPPGDAEGTSELSSEELEEVIAPPGDAEGTSETKPPSA